MNAKLLSGFGTTHSDKSRPYTTIDLAGIRALVDNPVSVDKLQAQWFIPSTLMTRTFREQEARGEFWMLWADLDQNPPGIDTVADLLRPLEVDYDIYASRSATVEVPKCRILIPLAAPLSGKRWSLCQEILNDLLEQANATPDRANERCGQLCFLPNKGAYYEAAVRRDNVFLDAAHVWADRLQEKEAALRKHEQAIEERRSQARERKASASISGELNLIDVFNATYPVEEVLLRAGYDQRGNRFRHPHSQSGSFSASVQDGRVNSLSTADPLYSNGQGAHDAFSAYTVLFAGGDSGRALRQAGDEMVRIGEESWNAVKRREYAIAHAPESMDFTELFKNLKAKAPRGEETGSVEFANNATPEPELAESLTSEFVLNRFVLNGMSGELEAQMLDDVFVLGRLAILGQSTAIYAPPNAGKTLITLALIIESIKDGRIDGSQIYYINADDNYKGLVTKLKLAEEYGFQMIAPDHKEFKLERFTDHLTKSIKEKTARGVVVILDTVKKFTDIMNKRVVSDFGKVIRAFVQAGGTVIMLAHVNKHRDEEDKPIAAGTSDIIDDVDCAYILDTHSQGFGEYLSTFENRKARGDVAMRVSYRFSRHEGQEYRELLATVSEVSQEEVNQIAKDAELFESRDKNADLIEQIKAIIVGGAVQKTDIITKAHKETRKSRDFIRKVLERHAGESQLMGYSWRVMTGPNNAQIYSVFDKHPLLSTKINTTPVATQNPSTTPANHEKPANPIQSEVYEGGETSDIFEKPANPIVIVLGGNNATTMNTCKLAYRPLAMDDDHVAITQAMAEYLKAKGRVDGLGDHHG